MTVNQFLNTISKDEECAEYYSEITIQTHSGDNRILAKGIANELLKLDDIKGTVVNLQGFSIVEMKRIPKISELTGTPMPAHNCPYLLLVI